MTLVFDTNVLFAAYIARGTCATLYEQALAVAALVTSDFILDEFERTLVTKGKVAPELAREARAKVATHSRSVAITALAERICRDIDDDAILATALAAPADFLVTGDKDLLTLVSYEGIPIITPAACLARLRA